MITTKNKRITKRKVISQLINIAIASAKLKNIILEEEHEDVSIRPQMNLLIYGRIGSTKSTILKQVARKTGCPPPITDITFPALVGSIDRITKMIVPAMCWDCRNSLLLLDEFNMGRENHTTVNAMLQLIEGGEYARSLSTWCPEKNDYDGDLFFKTKEGRINIKTRFALVFATMKNVEYTQSLQMRALLTRCVAIPYYPDDEELDEISEGLPVFYYQEIIPPQIDVKISLKDYRYIRNFVKKRRPNKENYLRTICDLCRVFAVFGKHDKKMYELICSMKIIEFKKYLGKQKMEVAEKDEG